jgi:hypothetical protein
LYRLVMHERIIGHVNKYEGMEWVAMAQGLGDFMSKNR